MITGIKEACCELVLDWLQDWSCTFDALGAFLALEVTL
jgi:hypothetical protein